jgi:drug/metabolite transporter (DMT)-like permease
MTFIYLPFVASLLDAIVVTVEKKILRKHNITARNFVVYAFFAIPLVMIPLVIFFWDVDINALQPLNLSLMGIIVIVSIFANVATAFALKREDLAELEPVKLMLPLFIVLIAFMFSFFSDLYLPERNPIILILALIASATLIASHIKKHHLKFDKYLIIGLIGSALFALELVLSRAILELYSPISFYFSRSALIFLISLIIFLPALKPLKKGSTKYWILSLAVGAVVMRILIYYGFILLGIVFTTMVLILSPVFVYIFAHFFLKEKVTKRQIIASVMIITCVVIAIIINN